MEKSWFLSQARSPFSPHRMSNLEQQHNGSQIPPEAGLGLLISCHPRSELVQGLLWLSLLMPTSVTTAEISQGPSGREKNHLTFHIKI